MLRLPIFVTILEAYAFVWRERRDFMALAFPAILVLATLNALFSFALPMPASDAGEVQGDARLGFILIILIAIGLVFYVMFSVPWHRRYLVPGEVMTVRDALRWRHRQTRFFAYAIMLAAIFIVVTMLAAPVVLLILALIGLTGGGEAGGATVALGLIVLWLAWAICVRLTLLFPAVAIDDPLSIIACWFLTRGNGWRIFVITLFTVLPIWAVSLAVALIGQVIFAGLGLVGNLTATFVFALVLQLFTYISLAVTVVALSIIYRRLKATSPPSMPGVFHMPPE